MASRPRHSFKTVFYLANLTEATPGPDYATPQIPDPTKYQKIAYVQSASGPNLDKTISDVKHLESPAKFVEKISGFKDAGQVTLNLLFHAPEYLQLVKLWYGTSANNYADDKFWFKIVDPDGGTAEVACLIKGIGKEVPEDNVVTCAVVFELTGPVLYTKPSGDTALSALASFAAADPQPTFPMA